MNLVRLTPGYELTAFDCGDEQLNNFLFEDAMPSLELRIANTFILEDDGRIVAYFCLLNDKVSKNEVIGSRWKKIRANFPRDKQFSSYPTIKIGRFAVSLDYQEIFLIVKAVGLLSKTAEEAEQRDMSMKKMPTPHGRSQEPR